MIGSFIVATIGFFIGVALIFIGERQNAAQYNEAVGRVVEATKKVEEGNQLTAKPKQERVFVPPELTPERLFTLYREHRYSSGRTN